MIGKSTTLKLMVSLVMVSYGCVGRQDRKICQNNIVLITKMYYPTSLMHFHDNYTTKSKRKVPLALTIFFFMLALIFGFNFGVTKMMYEKVQTISNYFITVLSLFITFLLYIPLKITNIDSSWYITTFLEYIGYILALKISKYTVWDFLTDLHSSDDCITRIDRFYIGVLASMYTLVIYTTKWIITYTECEIHDPGLCVYDYNISYKLYHVPALGVDFVSVVIFVTYAYVYCSIKDIKNLLKKELNIESLMRRYSTIADAFDRLRPLLNKLIICELMFEIPKMMGLMYNVVSYGSSANLISSLMEYIFALHIIAHIICSGAAMQMIRSEMDGINVCLHQMLIKELDEKKQHKITRVVSYIKARKLWRPVGGIIPVDLRLPVSTLSICATYLIVLVQFTHLI